MPPSCSPFILIHVFPLLHSYIFTFAFSFIIVTTTTTSTSTTIIIVYRLLFLLLLSILLSFKDRLGTYSTFNVTFSRSVNICDFPLE